MFERTSKIPMDKIEEAVEYATGSNGLEQLGLTREEVDKIIDDISKKLEILLEEKRKGTTILYSTHILNEVSKICDRIGIIKSGSLIKTENVENIKKAHIVLRKIFLYY